MVQNAANMWPIDKQKYFLTIEHNKQKKNRLLKGTPRFKTT